MKQQLEWIAQVVGEMSSRCVMLCIIAGILVACSENRTPESLLQDAQASIAKNDLAAASIQLKNALQINPNLASARLELGMISFKLRDYPTAARDLDKALELGASKDEVVPALAVVMLEMGKPQDMTSRFSSVRLGDAKAQARLDAVLGRSALVAGNIDRAGQYFDGALGVLPDEPMAVVGKARILASKNQLNDAQVLLKPLLNDSAQSADAWLLEFEILGVQGNREGALAALRKAYAARPEDLRSRLVVISMLASEHRLDEARSELAALRKIAPKALEGDYLNGLILLMEGKPAEARTSIDKVLSKSPDHIPTIWLAATAAYELKSYAQAEQYAEKLIARGADSIAVRRILITSYLRTGRIVKAQQVLEPLMKTRTTNPTVMSLAAQVQLASGDEKGALKYFEAAAANQPDDQGAQARVGIVRLVAGDYDGGVRALEEVARANDDTRADVLLVLAHLKNRNADAALDAVDALEKKKPGSPVAGNLRGSAYLLKKDFPAARRAFEAVLSTNPTYFTSAAALARLDLIDGKPEEAAKRFESILAHDANHSDAMVALAGIKARSPDGQPEAQRLLERAVKIHPDSVQALTALVGLHLVRKEQDKAIAVAQASIAANPENPSMLELLASTQTAVGAHAAAIQSWQKVVDLSPNRAAALSKLGIAQAAAGKSAEAEQSLRKSLQIQPNAIDVEAALAGVYRDRKATGDALRIARDIQKKHPASPIGFLIEGDIFFANDNRQGVVEAFRQAFNRERSAAILVRLLAALDLTGKESESSKLAADWSASHPKDVTVLSYRADLALAQGRFSQAKVLYESLVAIAPDNAVVLNNLAWVLWKEGSQAALGYVERAFRLDPQNANVLDTYGVILIESGKVKEGLEIMRKANAIAPQSNDILLNFSRALILAGRKDEARPHLTKLANLGRGFPRSAEAAKLLGSL